MTEQLLHQIDVTALIIETLCKRLPQAVCREFAVQPRGDKRFFEHLVCRLSVHRDRSVLVSRRCNRFVVLPVPADKILDCLPAVGIHRHGKTGDFTTFDDRFIKKQIRDGGTVLVNIADRQRQ